MTFEVEGDNDNNKTVKGLGLATEKFLGGWDCPKSQRKEQIKQISLKCEMWLKGMKNRHLPSYMGLMAYKYNL